MNNYLYLFHLRSGASIYRRCRNKLFEFHLQKIEKICIKFNEIAQTFGILSAEKSQSVYFIILAKCNKKKPTQHRNAK